MKTGHHIAAAVIVAALVAGALDAQQSTTAAAKPAAGDAVPRKYWLVTPVTLEASGRVETAGRPEILDSQAAYRLADMLATQEARERAGVTEAPGAGPATPGASSGRRRCAAIAASTGEQCRKYARPGSAYCEIHDPDAR